MFKSTRIKLTVWYLVIIMAISIAFSIVVYRLLSREFDRFQRIQQYRVEHLVDPLGRPIIIDLDTQPLEDAKHHLLLLLAIVDFVILVVSGGLGYFLAGKTLEPIQQMLDEQNRFISDASHELRTPLTALKSSMEVFLRDKKSTVEDAKVLIDSGIEDVENLTSLSNSLLQLAQYQKVSSVNQNLTFEQTSVKEITDSAISKVLPLADKKQLKITSTVADQTIYGNKFSLIDLFVILLDNAIKYSDADKSITLTSTKTDGHIKISVADQGIGVDAKDISKIFDRFYRASESRSKTDQNGYGLGLSIAKRIAEIHKGSINVESSKGVGTTFSVKIPLSQHSGGIQLERIS